MSKEEDEVKRLGDAVRAVETGEACGAPLALASSTEIAEELSRRFPEGGVLIVSSQQAEVIEFGTGKIKKGQGVGLSLWGRRVTILGLASYLNGRLAAYERAFFDSEDAYPDEEGGGET